MEVENSAAKAIAQKKTESEIEEQRLQMELARAAKERQRLIGAEREKTEKQLVEISQQASNQMEASKKLNNERVRALNDNSQKHFEELAASTAKDLQRLDAESLKTIQDHKAGAMEKIRNVTTQSEDPFYRLKGMNPALTETEKDFTIRVSLPEHEAKNLFVAGEGPYIKLSLARRYQDSAKNEEEKRVTKTNSFQSVVEQVAMPSAYDAKKIERLYENGVVTIKIPKLIFGEEAQKAGKGTGSAAAADTLGTPPPSEEKSKKS